jgi:ABC-2 type transport system permease protein
MQRIFSQCVKELSQFRRDRLTLSLAFILPLMTLIIFGFAIRLEVKDIPLTIQDLDNTPLSRAYIERLFATNKFVAAPEQFQGYKAPELLIDRGIAKAAIIIPSGFNTQVKNTKSSPIQVLIDATDTNNARVVNNIIQATTKAFLRSSQIQLIPDKIIPKIRIWFNPGRKESLYIVPGVYALILWVYPSLLTAIAMVREKEQGTMLQVYASDLEATELLLGKGLAYLIVAIGQSFCIMFLGAVIWGLQFAGSAMPLILGTLIFTADAVAFGLLIGVKASNQNAAIQVVSLIGFLTALLLSGFIYPLSNIPFPLSLVSNIVPARYYIEITRDAYVRGTGWAGVWVSLSMLIILGLFLFSIAKAGLKKMQLN